MPRIAFLGLGNMGRPMAANLVKAGHDVIGFDPFPAARDAAAADGVKPAETAGDAAREAEIVVTMLPTGRHVIELYRDPKGPLHTAPKGTLFIDSSTIDVASARTAADLAHEAGHHAVDAPVSGGTGGAAAGTLTFMIGGGDDAVARARPVLEKMGRKLVHCGGNGTGQAAKICNNMVLGISMIAAAEAFVLGEKLGLSHQALYDVTSTSSGQCWSITTYCPVPGMVPTSPANNGYKPGFATDLMLKDLRLAAETAEAADADTALGHLARDLYERFAASGHGQDDFSGIINDLRARHGGQS